MNIIYEVNPPKILKDGIFEMSIVESELKKFLDRIEILSEYTNYIHITDSVLGIPRISSIHAVQLIYKRLQVPNLKISCSVRTRDRNFNSIIQLTTQSLMLKINALLFVLGDKSSLEKKNSDKQNTLSTPTKVIKMLSKMGFNKMIDLNLSLPNKATSLIGLEKKIRANPHGFITQSINTLEEVKDLKKLLNPYRIKLIPCIMIPSEKNFISAKMIGLDWSEYKGNFIEFVDKIKDEGIDNILITSPNSFNEGIDFLKRYYDNIT